MGRLGGSELGGIRDWVRVTSRRLWEITPHLLPREPLNQTVPLRAGNLGTGRSAQALSHRITRKASSGLTFSTSSEQQLHTGEMMAQWEMKTIGFITCRVDPTYRISPAPPADINLEMKRRVGSWGGR